MAYHFRKLKQTLRIIPSTKSIGFTTRVNEGDQSKNSHIDTSSVSTNIDGNLARLQDAGNNDQITDTVIEEFSNNSIASAVLRSPNDSHLFNSLQPFLRVGNVNLPVAYKDIAQVLLPRISDDSSEDKDPIFSAVKFVKLTSDDILVHLNDTFADYSTSSSREQIPVDVLTQHFCRRREQDILNCARGTLYPDSVVFNDVSQAITESSINQQLTHAYYSNEAGASSRPKGNNHSKDGPSPEQMLKAREKLELLVLNLFRGHHDYDMLHKYVVLENNLFADNKVTIGLFGYKLELLKLRLYMHTKLFSMSMEILSVTTLEQTGVIRIHWRLKGLPQIQNLKFWRLFQVQSINKDDWEWLEAFSYFHIGKDGLVHKHRIDRMMPDDSQPDLTEKIRGFLNPAKPLVN